jgi:hypothetical protein
MTKRTQNRPHRPPPPSLFPGWLWAGVIMGSAFVVLFVVNTLSISFTGTGQGISIICYSVQLFAYLLTGMLAGHWEKDRYLKERIRNPLAPPPNYLIAGALAAVVVVLFAAIVYIATNAAVVDLVPAGTLLLGNSIFVLLLVDAVAAIGLGSVGGLVYGRILA